MKTVRSLLLVGVKMEELTNMDMFELACELNRIMIEINKLEIRHNQVVREIHSRNEKLKNDPNLQPKVLRKEITYDRDQTNKW